MLALLLANLAFFALTRGEAVRAEREPDRHAQQVRPEAVRLLTPAGAASATQSAAAVEAAAASAAAATAARCLEAGPFNTAEVATAEAALVASPAASSLAQRWSRISPEAPDTPNAASAVHHLRVDAATPEEAAALESLPAGVLIRAFTPCPPR